MTRIEQAMRPSPDAEQPSFGPPLEPEERSKPDLDPSEERRLEVLFAEAERDRSRAYRLKQELDRLKVFDQFEDRFLDLFKASGNEEDGNGREESAA